MSTTSILPTNREWLRRLISGRPHQVIGGTDNPYLRRWYLIPRNPVLNVYLHQFLRSDDDRALHDHPWPFVSLILSGEYDEITEQGTIHRGRGSIAFRRAEWRHRVQLTEELTTGDLGNGGGPVVRLLPCWTLIVTGRRSREWGFWCPARGGFLTRAIGPKRFVPWRDFGDAGCGEVAS
ncbi:hypothetical protein [Gordonia soli]|uniref:Cupin 2 conserved barrel domain-containing protein n=1 Tax=Gordonia soli NBRC 108243 TaxID=1223545 RepID=M0QQD9_9ACTN|nr:hypothetical protein [Gordonia soli]GAC70798.1 hypothetical protein GS4_41_00450 [Gordonia soli NBRC 108243]